MTNFHFSSFVHQQAEKYNQKIAFRHKDETQNRWILTSWSDFSKQVKMAAKAFAAMGVNEEENIAIFSQNKPEIFISDFAMYANRAVCVPMYATSSISQIDYIITDAEISIVLAGEQEQYEKTFELIGKNPFLKRIIVFDSNVKLHENDKSSLYFSDFLKMGESNEFEALVKERTNRASEEDLANLIYTSGTTGIPKGVMITHKNYIESMRIHDIRLYETTENDVSLCFLPLTHIFEKAWSYFCLFKGVEIAINLRPIEVQQTLREIRPTIMCSVPRFWEKVYSGVQEKIAQSGTISQLIMNSALKIGTIRNLEYARNEQKAPFYIEWSYKLFDRIVFQKLKKTIGIENGNYFPVAGSPLSDKINIFMHACGIDILYGYGLTETTATVSCFFKKGYQIGTVGVEMPRIEVKIGENNEIMVKGNTVMKGYYKKPEDTAQVLSEDGWFKTGDAGLLSDNGVITITERIKDLIKTSNGKYVAPQALEMKIGEDKYIDQIAVIGDQRKYITALIIPAYEALKEYAVSKQIVFQNMDDLLKNSTINQLFQDRINELQKNFSKFEQIKKFTLLPYPFTLEGGELTNTLKLRRSFIQKQYSSVIEEMYV